MSHVVYSDEHKARAVELYRLHGPREAHRRFVAETGLTPDTKTIIRWASFAGVECQVLDRCARARETQAAQNAARRERIRVKLLRHSEGLLDRLSDAKDADCPRLATAVGILIDKYRLEMGEVTGREEVRHDLSDRSTADLIAEAESILREAGAAGGDTPGA